MARGVEALGRTKRLDIRFRGQAPHRASLGAQRIVDWSAAGDRGLANILITIGDVVGSRVFRRGELSAIFGVT